MSDGNQDFATQTPAQNFAGNSENIPEPELEFGTTTPATASSGQDASGAQVVPAAVIDAPESAPAGNEAEGDAGGERLTLTPAEQQKVDAFVKKIDITDSTGVLGYGVGSQKKVADFSERALTGVRGRDLGEMGDELGKLIVTLKDFDADEKEKGGLFGLFKKGKNKVEGLKARYDEVEKSVADISEVLEGHQRTLLKDISMLDQMYEVNEAYFHELTMYVAAGKEKLAQVRANDLPAAQKKAQESGLAEDAQSARDLAQMCDRFEKRVHDLELTRTIALQTAPQIRLIQSADQVMAEKIQSTVVNTIPLWKNQMVIALGVEHTSQAARAQREVTDMTNQLLKENADRLKSAAVETARESERGIVDIETLQHTNQQLISTLDEIAQVQTEGRAKRREAEAELTRIEGELRDKMLEVSGK